MGGQGWRWMRCWTVPPGHFRGAGTCSQLEAFCRPAAAGASQFFSAESRCMHLELAAAAARPAPTASGGDTDMSPGARATVPAKWRSPLTAHPPVTEARRPPPGPSSAPGTQSSSDPLSWLNLSEAERTWNSRPTDGGW